MSPASTDSAYFASVACALRLAALAAGEVARRAFLDGNPLAMCVEHKQGYFDIVSAADREAEAVAQLVLRQHFPDARILGEEGGWTGCGELVFYVDPIDGTSNFASGLPIFCVSIGAYRRGTPVGACIYDPLRDEMFMATNGAMTLNGATLRAQDRGTFDSQVELLTNAPHEGAIPSHVALAEFGQQVAAFRAVRRLGSCALHLAYVAARRAAICHEVKFQSWDVAAGLQLVAASGGQVVAWDRLGRRMASPLECIEEIRRVVVAIEGYELERSCLPGLGRKMPDEPLVME